MTSKTRRWFVASVALAAVVFAGCISIDIDGEGFGNGEDGSGFLVTEQRTVADFSVVDVSGALRVEVEQGRLGIEVEFDDNLLDKLETRVRDGEIRVLCRDCSPSSGAVVRLTTPEVERIEVSGASRVTALGIDTEELEISVSGASRIEISGTATQLSIDGSGASTVDGPGLQVERLNVDLSGASRGEIEVLERVDGDLSGASRLTLAGATDPVVNVDTSGGSSVSR